MKPSFSPPPTSRAIINTGKKCGPSVAADGDLWTVYKLQSWNQQRCPKYVIQTDQSERQGKHSLVRVPRLTNSPWRMGPSRGYRLIFFPRSRNRTSAFALRRLDSVTQGWAGGTIIWSTMKCIAVVVFYRLIFTAQNGLWASPSLTYLKRWVWPVNGPGSLLFTTSEFHFLVCPLTHTVSFVKLTITPQLLKFTREEANE